MKICFPLADVSVKEVTEPGKVTDPLHDDDLWQISQHEFAMKVEGVGSFYACYGSEIEYSAVHGVSEEEIHLYLNGSVYGAILYQRGILPLHGSCFSYNQSGVMLCGESGVGKSALTAAFTLNGGIFYTDDVTPVIISDDKPCILPFSDRIKLWEDTFSQINLDKSGSDLIRPDYRKYYLRMGKSTNEMNPLNLIYVLSLNDGNEAIISEISGSSKFPALYNQIYRREYLKGMPEIEKKFFDDLIKTCNEVRVFNLARPEKIAVTDLMEVLKEHIGSVV